MGDPFLQTQFGTLIQGESGKTFDAVVEHWAKARIDNPLHVISRLDDAARQVIVVAGALEGLTIAVLKLAEGGKPAIPAISIAGSVLLLGAVLFAVKALFRQPKYLGAYPIYKLFRFSEADRLLDGLDKQVEEWCDDIKAVVQEKQRLTNRAMVALAGGIGMMVLCVSVNILS